VVFVVKQQTETGMQVSWTALNQATDAAGFLLESEASFAAELELLASLGCPDTSKAKLVRVEVVGRQESVMTAEVSDAMGRWLFKETDAEDFEEVA
jgi:hypothetical protein